MAENLLLETHPNGILSIQLNRPDKLNALNESLIDELSACFKQAQNDKAIKAVLISGQGKAFCAGADIKRLQNADDKAGLAFAEHGQTCFNLLQNLGKPSLAAINGYAFGGGCELAMAAHMRIASTEASFAQPEVKLGVIPGFGGTQRLSRLVGVGRALDLCLTGRVIKAEEALTWGLISEVTSAEDLLNRAMAILTELVKLAPLAMEYIATTIHQGFDMPLNKALHFEAEQFAKICLSQDCHEGVNAFLEKRTPEFKGE